MSSEERIEQLEIKLSHLEQAHQQLSTELYRQQQQLDLQESRYRRLLDRLEAGDRQHSAEGQFEIPPHY
jgi:uncharacterized coiled-coil protein SlyX